MKLDSVLSRVVLPLPVPPLTIMLSRALIAPSSSMTISGVKAPNRKKVLEGQGIRAEAPDRDGGAVERQRGNDRVDARAVRQTRVAHGLVSSIRRPTFRHDPVEDLHQVVVIAEGDLRPLDASPLFEEDILRTVDHDVGDALFLEERLEGSEPEGFVQKPPQ